MIGMETRIRRKLEDGLSPIRLDIVDDSHKHVGHAGARPEGESHFSIRIVSADFTGKSRVERQRVVYGLLVEEFAAGLHALALTTLTPAEDDSGPAAA